MHVMMMMTSAMTNSNENDDNDNDDIDGDDKMIIIKMIAAIKQNKAIKEMILMKERGSAQLLDVCGSTEFSF